MLSEHQLTYGYWPSRQLSGLNPKPIRHPGEYDGSDTISISCTQTGLQPRVQRDLVRAWCSLLPRLPARTVLFTSKVDQALFEAAVENPGLQALFVKWSSVGSIAALSGHPRLTSLYLGSSPSATGLDHLSTLPALRHLFLAGVREAADLRFAATLPDLREFGLSGGSRTLTVESLAPLSGMHGLQILWLVRVRPTHDGLRPLHALAQLRSLRSSFDPRSRDVLELRKAVPGLQYLQPVH